MCAPTSDRRADLRTLRGKRGGVVNCLSFARLSHGRAQHGVVLNLCRCCTMCMQLARACAIMCQCSCACHA